MKNHMRILVFLIAAGCAGLTAGCLVTTRAAVATPTVDANLVEIQPGVWVVADYDDSVFYSDGHYWRWHGGTWYQSSVYYGSWSRVRVGG